MPNRNFVIIAKNKYICSHKQWTSLSHKNYFQHTILFYLDTYQHGVKMFMLVFCCFDKPIFGVTLFQRFPVPVFSIPIPVLRLSSLGNQFRFRDCPWLEHDSESGSETAQALNSILIPVPRLHRLRIGFRFWDDSESWPKSLGISVPFPDIFT